MLEKFEVVLTLDVDFESDVRTFLSDMDEMKYSIKSIKNLKRGN